MPCPPLSFIHINIHNVAFQANSLPNSGGRGIQQNTMSAYNRAPNARTYPNPLNFTPPFSHATERRIEVQPRIRRMLEEVSTHPEGPSSRLSPAASLAVEILSVVEKDIPRNTQLIDLAMEAHALTYIAVISCLYRRPGMSKRTTKKLIKLLGMTHAFLLEAANAVGILARLKYIATRSQRKAKVIWIREELLKLLRQIERDDNADIISSLNAALDCQ